MIVYKITMNCNSWEHDGFEWLFHGGTNSTPEAIKENPDVLYIVDRLVEKYDLNKDEVSISVTKDTAI